MTSLYSHDNTLVAFWWIIKQDYKKRYLVTGRLAPVVFVLYLFLSFSTLFFYHDPLYSNFKLPMAFLSSQGTEVNKNSTSYTSVVSLQKKKKKKKKKKKEKKNKERVWGQTKSLETEASLPHVVR